MTLWRLATRACGTMKLALSLLWKSLRWKKTCVSIWLASIFPNFNISCFSKFPAFPYLVISVLHQFPNFQLFQILKFPGFTFRDFKIASLDSHFMHLQHFCYLQYVQLSSSTKNISFWKLESGNAKIWKLRTMQNLETVRLWKGKQKLRFSFFQGLAQTKLQFSGKESEFFPLSKRHLSLKKHLSNINFPNRNCRFVLNLSYHNNICLQQLAPFSHGDNIAKVRERWEALVAFQWAEGRWRMQRFFGTLQGHEHATTMQSHRMDRPVARSIPWHDQDTWHWHWQCLVGSSNHDDGGVLICLIWTLY